MSFVRGSIGWIARHAFVFVLIIIALITHQYLTREWESASVTTARLESLERVSEKASEYERQVVSESNARLLNTRKDGIAELDRKIAATDSERRGLVSARPKSSNIAFMLLTAGPDALLEDQKREMQIVMLTHQLNSLRALRNISSLNRQSFDLNARLSTQIRRRDQYQRICVQLNGEIENFRKRWVGSRVWNRSAFEQLKARRNAACGERNKAHSAINKIQGAQSTLRAKKLEAARAIDSSKARARSKLSATAFALRAQIAQDEALVRGSIKARIDAWAKRVDLGGKARAAAFVLLGIILMPFVIRTFLYYVFAPIAERRPSIKIGLPSRTDISAAPTGQRSQVSIGIKLDKNEELLVRQGFLQSTSVIDHKRSQWFIDWRYPLTSVASGLTFLTRIRGSQTQTTTVSAVNDPLAEVAELVIPDGSSCVIHPRALVAVLLPIGRPLKITSHWRLNSLNAWLTMQLRFLVFHGPSRIILKGSRGLRIEKAERGRIFGQDQLVGFSSDLAYSVARTETFLPYLFGHEGLLKDTVAEGSGLLIIEESPMAGRRGSGAKRGLEGAVDAALKVVGV